MFRDTFCSEMAGENKITHLSFLFLFTVDICPHFSVITFSFPIRKTVLVWVLLNASFWKIYRRYFQEIVAYIHDVIVLSHKKEWNFVFWNKIDGVGNHNVYRNKAVPQKTNIMFYLICGSEYFEYNNVKYMTFLDVMIVNGLSLYSWVTVVTLLTAS